MNEAANLKLVHEKVEVSLKRLIIIKRVTFLIYLT
jgi:hypothetical protein